MSEYDIYLNSKGYMLAKDSKGGLVPGAAREQIVDPFTSFLSRDEPYTRAPFRFGDGAGLHDYDGSSRYEWGHGVDARSGRLLAAPERIETAEPTENMQIHDSSVIVAEALDSDTGQQGIAQRFQMPASPYTTVRSVGILVKRSEDYNYATTPDFSVGIFADASGQPGSSLGYVSVSIKKEDDRLAAWADRWRNGDWFWIEVVFSSDIVVGASTYFWVYVLHTQPRPLYWAEDQYGGAVATRSVYNGTAWGTAASDYQMMVKVGYKDGTAQFDSFIRCFAQFRGSGDVQRIYAGTGYRVLTWLKSSGTAWWTEANTMGYPVMQLLEFDSKLFAACGTATDFWWSSGATGTSTDWTQITGHKASALAVHDHLLWKADGRAVKGSADGLASSWGATAVDVGDNGTPVEAMVSHGGKLFAAKPEGIFEISYPDTYPTSGKPTANMMLDFSTERCNRPWMLDWHSGLYFPGLGGVYEFKNNVLRNIWEDKIDEGALDAAPTGLLTGGPAPFGAPKGGSAPYTKPRSWSPLYDHGPIGWPAAHGATRGLLFARCNPHTETSDLIWWDGRNWFSLRAAGDTASDGGPRLRGEYITACFVQDVGGGRGWMWWNEGFGLARTEWPTWTADTADDTTTEYERYAQAVTPWFTLAEASKKMLPCKVGITSEQFQNPITMGVYYRTNKGGTWISLGTVNTSPYQELDFLSTASIYRIQFQLRFDLGASSSSSTPIIDQLDFFYQVLPEITTTHQLILTCAGDLPLRTGGVDERTAGEILAELRSLATGQQVFTYTDLLGADHDVRVTALTGQMMNELTGPGPEGVGVEAQVIVNLLEV